MDKGVNKIEVKVDRDKRGKSGCTGICRNEGEKGVYGDL